MIQKKQRGTSRKRIFSLSSSFSHLFKQLKTSSGKRWIEMGGETGVGVCGKRDDGMPRKRKNEEEIFIKRKTGLC